MTQIARHPAAHRRLRLTGQPIAALDCAARPGAPSGGTAVLVPGYTGGKEDFAAILGPLADRGFRVVAIDLPGQYESPGPRDPSAYAVEALAGVVGQVVDLLGDGPVHLVGHSFGGLVARATAIAAPSRLRSLVLLDSGPASVTGARRDRLKALNPILAAGGMPAVYAAMERLDALDPRAASVPPPLREFLRTRFLASSPLGLRTMGEALRREPDRVSELRATGLPVLVAYGAADDAWAPAVQAEMAERLGAERAVVAGAAHSPAAERPAATTEVLVGFWRRVEDEPRA